MEFKKGDMVYFKRPNEKPKFFEIEGKLDNNYILKNGKIVTFSYLPKDITIRLASETEILLYKKEE